MPLPNLTNLVLYEYENLDYPTAQATLFGDTASRLDFSKSLFGVDFDNIKPMI